MSNFKFHSNRQVALQMAIEYRKSKGDLWPVVPPGDILTHADIFYKWLQDAPMKDEDQKQWFTDPIIKTKNYGKNTK